MRNESSLSFLFCDANVDAALEMLWNVPRADLGLNLLRERVGSLSAIRNIEHGLALKRSGLHRSTINLIRAYPCSFCLNPRSVFSVDPV